MKEGIKIGLLSILVAGSIFIGLDVHKLLLDADKTLEDADVILTASAPAARNASGMIEKINTATDRELLEFSKTQAALRETIVFTDKNLNDPRTGVLPKLRQVADDSDLSILVASESLKVISDGLGPSLANLTKASAAAADALANPAIKETVQRIDETSAHVDAIAANGQIASDLALAKFREYLKPPKLIITILDRVIGPVAEIATAIYTARASGAKTVVTSKAP